MLLSQLIAPLIKRTVVPTADVDIRFITTDSRKVEAGTLFIAIRGYTVDGHRFVQESANRGAVAALVEELVPGVSIPQVVVPDTQLASALVADLFYRHPSHKLRMIGVTGTNGKTTVTHLIERVLADAGHVTGLYGTVGSRIAGRTREAVNTTPEAVELQSVLGEMVTAGCTYGIMEVSSHALELRRTAGTRYHIAVFTNLTQDHLDFHGTMDNYRAAKGKLFSRLGNEYGDDRSTTSYAVLNADDAATPYLAAQTVVECITYGIQSPADIRAEHVEVRADGVCFHVSTFAGEADVNLQLTGRFNVYNALAAIAVGLVEGIPLAQVVTSLQGVPGISGRFERVSGGQDFAVLVDYSHTPDSLENALLTVREFARGKVYTVVGCGGDRDRTKRPIMAQIAAKYSDVTLLTSDNPRTEDPEVILDDMESGLRGTTSNYQRISDREAAIRSAVERAEAGDVVLIAGKGHETYQIIGKTKHHFDDREVALTAIQRRVTQN